jgi:hypothetical protein
VTLAEAVRGRLLSSPAVAALVGGGAAARIHWVKRDQGGALPAIVLTQVSRIRRDHLDGPEDMIVSRVQADCWATTHRAATTLATAVRAALIGAAEIGDVQFWRATTDGPRDLGEDTESGFLHRASLDLTLRHTAGTE